MYWYESKNIPFSPVISTRVRLARNISGIPFPERLSPDKKTELFNKIKESYSSRNKMVVPFFDCDEILKYTYVQTHLASSNLVENPDGAGLILPEENSVSIMINEEDHIRIQAIESGYNVDKCFENAVNEAKFIETNFDIAYEDSLGYLTSCPTNLGAAMRVSVMIHLPCISISGRMNKLINVLGDAGYTVRGMFGEGTGADGFIYQISNQSSKEKDENSIISDFKRIIGKVITEELTSAENLYKNNKNIYEDKVSRALGTLKYSRKMAFSEFLSLYSELRTGKEMKMDFAEKISGLDRLFIEVMPYPMILKNRALSDSALRDEERSLIIRNALE